MFDVKKLADMSPEEIQYAFSIKWKKNLKIKDPILEKYDLFLNIRPINVPSPFNLTGMFTREIYDLYMKELNYDVYSIKTTPFKFLLNTFMMFMMDTIYNPKNSKEDYMMAVSKEFNNLKLGYVSHMDISKEEKRNNKIISSLTILEGDEEVYKLDDKRFKANIIIMMKDEYSYPFLMSMVEDLIDKNYMASPLVIKDDKNGYVSAMLDRILAYNRKEEDTIKKTVPSKNSIKVYLYQ